MKINELKEHKEKNIEIESLTDFQKIYKDMYPCISCKEFRHIMILDNNGLCKKCQN